MSTLESVPGFGTPATALALAVMLLLLLPAASAQGDLVVAFGSVAEPGDADVVPRRLASLPRAEVCRADLDGDGEPGASEPLLLLLAGCSAGAGAGRANEGDLRLQGPGAGRLLRAGDAELSAAALPAPVTLAFRDLDEDGHVDPAEPWYLVPTGEGAASATAVAPGHVRLSSPAGGNLTAGSVVTDADPDHEAQLTPLPTAEEGHVAFASLLRYWDVRGSGIVDPGDALYLDLDRDGNVSVGDLRLRSGPGSAMSGFGSGVAVGDADVTPRLQPLDFRPALCFLDLDQDGTFDGGEPLFLQRRACPSRSDPPDPVVPTLAEGDLRFSGPAFGTFVEPDQSELAGVTWSLATLGAFRFTDQDRDGRWSQGDVLYLHTQPARTLVTAGDLRLTPYGSFPPGSVVRQGHSDLKFLTVAAGPGTSFDATPTRMWRFWDVDGDARLSPADVLYIDGDDNGRVNPQDVRLTPLMANPAGSVVSGGDPDVRPFLQPGVSVASLCYVDRAGEGSGGDGTGDGVWSPGESIYFQRRPCGQVLLDVGDVRLSGPRAGSKVAQDHDEFGAATSFLPGGANVRFYDADGDVRWSAGDTLYLHTAPGRTRVADGDLRLTSYGTSAPGTLVVAGDKDLDLVTHPHTRATAVHFNWRFWDLTATLDLDGSDVLYIDADGNGVVSPMDVRLSLLPDPSAPPRTLADQVSQLLDTVEALEASVGRASERATELEGQLRAANATMAALQADLEALEDENQRLRTELKAANQSPPPAEAPVDRGLPGPGSAALLLVALAVARSFGRAVGRRER